MSRIEKILQAMIDETSYNEAPQSRIEAILLAIKNNTQYSHLPHSRIEEILLAIKNNTSYDKEPMSRIEEILLAKLNLVEYKKPVQSKIEKLLLKWLYQDLYLTLKGVPPLTFTANGQPLADWTIYGNTINGESVGDRTANLFDKNLCIEHAIIDLNGNVNIADTNAASVSDFIPVTSNNSYTISNTGSIRGKYYKGDYSAYQVSDFDFQPNQNSNTFVIPESVKYIRFTINNAVGVESVMLCEGSTLLPYEPYGYKVPVMVSNGTDTLTTPIYLPEQIRKVGDEAEYIDYAEQKQHRVRKNLLQNMATDLTTYGVTITVNDDGSVTCNGTATSTIVFSIFEKELGQNIYILSGCPENGAQNERYKMQINPGGGWYADIGNGLEFEIQNTSTIKVRLVIYPSYTCDNLTFYPMIRKADIEDDTYEPYIENTDLDVTLPALPTIKGTNTLTVGTEVQPSNMEIIYTPKEPELKLMMKKKIEVMKNEQRT